MINLKNFFEKSAEKIGGTLRPISSALFGFNWNWKPRFDSPRPGLSNRGFFIEIGWAVVEKICFF